MPRAPRVVAPGAVYHVSARGNRRQALWADDRDRERFLSLLGRIVARRGWKLHAYCLMPNHYHLVLETPGDLSLGLRDLNGGYAQWFNRRHGQSGHLFQGRFHAVLVTGTWQALTLARYVVSNPVRAGLVESAGAWPWSSFRAFVGTSPAPPYLTLEWLLGLFGEDPRAARAAFRAFARDGPRPERRPEGPRPGV